MKGQNPNRSNSQKNGHRRSNSRYNNNGNNGNSNGQPSVNSNGDEEAGNNKLIFLISKSLGKKCIATLTNGARYQGILISGDLSSHSNSALSIVLHHPILISKGLINEKSNIDNELPEKLIVQSMDLIDLEVDEIDINDPIKRSINSKQSPQLSSQSQTSDISSKFKTDTDISGRLNVRERELERWVPDEDLTHNPALTLNADDHKSGAWDQFKVNEEKFGVESSYDEHLYTTRIDTSAADYEDRVKRAERIAREIEGQVTSDRHILEERGIQIDDSGIDEEDKYSGVDRRGDELMAALRNTSISNDNSNNSSFTKLIPGKYVPPRQRAAQYHNDPAIIASSAISKPNAVSESPTSTPIPTSESPVPSASISGDISSSKDPESIAQSHAKSVNITNSKITSKPESIPPKPVVGTPQPHNESFRLNAQSEINSLREFSANFKIPHKLPSDLLPILTKDKLKQDEILKKQHEQQALKKEREEKEKEKEQQPVQTQTQTQQEVQKKKLDPSKPAFKLNPKAAVFTPSSKHNQLSPTPPKANYQRSPNNPSPRMSTSRAYSQSNGSSGSSLTIKRHHQISPADFFGGVHKIPTKESQQEKSKSFHLYFNLFVTTRKKYEEKEKNDETGPLIYEKAFQTPPTWDSTIDDTHEKLFPVLNTFQQGAPVVIPNTNQFIPSPLMSQPSIPTGYPSPVNSKFPLSPHQQQQQQAAAAAAMAHFQQQQQQFHAAMLYQQQFPPPGQPPISMYPGGEPAFLPPGGFMPPPGGYVSGGSPVNGNLMLGGGVYNPNNGAHNNGHHGYNNHHHSGSGRRYSKRGSHS
ncbi:uncharacterized protein RJT21DRAFT_250 [Scheffersomyces amazonensis]|uniref:uncharacterized protein n=1 Tax=Scheffersomyces amazonensis TaxID=1078765 RepID=UPI00315DF184